MKGSIMECIKFLAEQEQGSIWEVSDPRNLSQNAMYWKVLGQMAKQLNISIPRLHNMQLRKYSSVLEIGGEKQILMVRVADDIEESMMESTTIHPMPTAQCRVGKDGHTLYRAWYLLKPSHEMSKKEFSSLIEGTLEDAREMGVKLEAVV